MGPTAIYDMPNSDLVSALPKSNAPPPEDGRRFLLKRNGFSKAAGGPVPCGNVYAKCGIQYMVQDIITKFGCSYCMENNSKMSKAFPSGMFVAQQLKYLACSLKQVETILGLTLRK